MEKNVLWHSSEKFKLCEKPIRLIELFAGIGAQAKALDVLGVNYEHYRVCEIDKYAIKSYNAIHHTNFETSDITKINSDYLGIVDTDKYNYIFTYSFPCTDLSVAGTMSGMSKADWESGKSTRSGLLWEVERLLDECYVKNGKSGLPQVLLMENVPQVVSAARKNGHSNLDDFTMWITKLESLGYSNFCKILDASETGYPEPIPQQRKRCFMISLLGDYDYVFPEKSKLNKKLKDLLEPVVDEKYYLTEKYIDYLTGVNQKESMFPRGERFKQALKTTNVDNIATTLTTSGREATSNFIVDFIKENNKNAKHQQELLQSEDDICRTLCCSGTGDKLRTVIGGFTKTQKSLFTNGGNVKRNINSDVIDIVEDGNMIDLSFPNGHENASRVTNLSRTLDCQAFTTVKYDYYIRRLTSKEAWRLMGFEDSDWQAAHDVEISDTQLYKQAGNSIVVNCLAAIFKNLI